MSKGKQMKSMPLFEWMNRSRHESLRPIQKARSKHVIESLMMELIWHMKECQRLANLSTDKQKFQEPTTNVNWLRSSPSLEHSIQPEDQSHLELLCSKIHPSHVEAVLCKCREVLSDVELRPQERINIFKQVLQDSINKAEDNEQQCVKEQQTKKHTSTPSKASKRVFQHKDEIPTISSYVDRSLYMSNCSAKNLEPSTILPFQ